MSDTEVITWNQTQSTLRFQELDNQRSDIKLENEPTDGQSQNGHYISNTVLTIAIVIIGILVFTIIVLIMICHFRRKEHQRVLRENLFELELQTVSDRIEAEVIPDHQCVGNSMYKNLFLDPSIQVFLREQVNLVSQIGEGCFGKVYKGTLKGKDVAVKLFKKNNAEDAMKEVETMASFFHPNILGFIGIVRISELEAPWIILEFMEHGDLAKLLRNSVNKFNPNQSSGSSSFCSNDLNLPQTISDEDKGHPLHYFITNEYLMDFALQISDGMTYLAFHHFVHRDLAARNCLVSADGVIKISDFGLSRDVYNCDYYKIKSHTKLLPLRWMSPESIAYGRFTIESDIYAYGVLLWELFTNAKQPYYGHDNKQTMKMILDGILLNPPDNCPNIICEIMTSCWKTEPEDRLKFNQILKRLKNRNRGKDMELRSGLQSQYLSQVCDTSCLTVRRDSESRYEIPKSFDWKTEYMEVI